MSRQKKSTSSMITEGIIALFTFFQVGLSGMLIYFIINEITFERGPSSGLMWFLIIMIMIAAVDLFLLYRVVQLIDTWDVHGA